MGGWVARNQDERWLTKWNSNRWMFASVGVQWLYLPRLRCRTAYSSIHRSQNRPDYKRPDETDHKRNESNRKNDCRSEQIKAMTQKLTPDSWILPCLAKKPMLTSPKRSAKPR
jgi:hypothetical protein